MENIGRNDPFRVGDPFRTSSLEGLETAQQKQLLDKIDELRSHGIDDLIDLPQLVVCGEQSSGKSSVLEALTEVPFPRNELLCTRFATEIILRRSSVTTASVKIIPHGDRSAADKERLEQFGHQIESLERLPDLINAATAAMGIDPELGTLSRDVLSIEITGPNRPHLTVVDLPGLIRSLTLEQTERDKELVHQLITDYITKPRTIILLVVNAKYEYPNQGVLDFVRLADPERTRTLGIITHADMLTTPGVRNVFFKLAKNEDPRHQLHLGWHFLRNRSPGELSQDFTMRNQAEDQLFAFPEWRALPGMGLKFGERIGLGIDALRKRLSELLFNLILKELPKVDKEIRQTLAITERALKGLGNPRISPLQQSLFLSDLSKTFFEVAKAGIDGLYVHEFFGESLIEPKWKTRRLRAIIQNQNIAFSKTMRIRGHRRDIHNPRQDAQGLRRSRGSDMEATTREEALNWVKEIAIHARGQELPGTLNPFLISELFWDQSKPWANIAMDHLHTQFDSIYEFLRLLMDYLQVPPEVAEKIFNRCIDPAMEARKAEAKSELQRLLDDRRRYAMTYSPEYLAAVRKRKAIRQAKWELPSVPGAQICEALGLDEAKITGLGLVGDVLGDKVRDWATKVIREGRAPGQVLVDDQNEELLDCMLSYYDVALKNFIDNVNNQVIERRLVHGLGDVFNSSTITVMPPDCIAEIAGESPEQKKRRLQLERRNTALQEGLAITRSALLTGVLGNKDARVKREGADEFSKESEVVDEDASSSDWNVDAELEAGREQTNAGLA